MPSMILITVVLVNIYLKWEFAHISRHCIFAVVPDHSHRKSLTDPLPALVPDPADGQGNGKDFDFQSTQNREKTLTY